MLFSDQLKTDTNGISVSNFETVTLNQELVLLQLMEALTQLVE